MPRRPPSSTTANPVFAYVSPFRLRYTEEHEGWVTRDALACLHIMTETVRPAARPLSGRIRLPGDKSISHRYAMIASIAEGDSRIANYSTGADCHSTLACVEALGAKVRKLETATVEIDGRGLLGLQAPAAALDAGNSGSTIRMLSGILSAQSFTTTIGGDESLSRRPMGRIQGCPRDR